MSLRKTFPLDRKKLKARKNELILKSPVNWLSLAGGILLILVFKLGFGKALIVLALMGFCLKQYWSIQGESLESDILTSLIHESNKEQDQVLRSSIRDFKREGRYNYAVTLGRFLFLKQSIEQRLHEDSEITDNKKQIENLVDEICFRVRDNINRIIDIEEKTASILVSYHAEELIETDQVRRKLLMQIVEAFSTLSDTYDNLEILLNPGLFESESGETLDEIIERLQSENTIIKNVHEEIYEEIYKVGKQE